MLYPDYSLDTRQQIFSILCPYHPSPSIMSHTLCPSIFTLPQTPLPTNSRVTATVTEQSETEELISELLALTAPHKTEDASSSTAENIKASATILRRQEHNVFLASTLFRLPGGYVFLDASRTWLVYWTVHSLDILGIALDQETKNRYVNVHLHIFVAPALAAIIALWGWRTHTDPDPEPFPPSSVSNPL